MTCAQMVVEQAIAAKAILYGDQQHFLWDPRSSRTDYEETLSSVATVIKLIIDRLEAEFPKQALENCFSIFDVAAARKARDTDRFGVVDCFVKVFVSMMTAGWRRPSKNFCHHWSDSLPSGPRTGSWTIKRSGG